MAYIVEVHATDTSHNSPGFPGGPSGPGGPGGHLHCCDGWYERVGGACVR